MGRGVGEGAIGIRAESTRILALIVTSSVALASSAEPPFSLLKLDDTFMGVVKGLNSKCC